MKPGQARLLLSLLLSLPTSIGADFGGAGATGTWTPNIPMGGTGIYMHGNLVYYKNSVIGWQSYK